MHRYIPVNELPNELGGQPNIAWNIDPGPYIETDRMVFDSWAGRLVMRLAGLSGARLSLYQGDQDIVSGAPRTISGINPDGSATGSADVTVSHAVAHRGSLERSDKVELPHMHWPVADIQINRTMLSPLISADVTAQKRTREEAFAHHLSGAIAAGFMARARENLVTEPLLTRGTIGLGTGAVLSTTAIGLFGTLRGVLVNYGLVHLVSAGFGFWSKKIDPETHTKLRLSLLPYGFQPDRLALASLVAHNTKLVKIR